MTALPTEDHVRIWRAPLGYRVFFGLFAIAMVVGVCLPWGTGGFAGDVGLRLIALGAGAFWLVTTYRSRMELRAGELVLRYTWTTRVIPLTTLVSVTPGREGLTFETADGASYASPFGIGEKAPLSSWIGRRTKADRIADVILAARPGA